jgi:hypothetical protein
MSRRGNGHDTAAAENFFRLLKRKRIRRRSSLTRDAARQDAFAYTEMFCNQSASAGTTECCRPLAAKSDSRNRKGRCPGNWRRFSPTNQQRRDIPTAAHRLHCPTDRVTAMILKLHIPLRRDSRCDSRFRAFRVHLPTLREAIASGALPPGMAARMIGVDIRTLRALIGGAYVESVTGAEPQSGRHRGTFQKPGWKGFGKTTLRDAAGLPNPPQSRCRSHHPGRSRHRALPLPLPERCQTIYRLADIG